ncbi:MAG: HEAT repeat domain-containing protein [Kiritimatiellae bacterium]|nr:HEAT repeat domain-containing protein [Kiritimatiellia bacterium]
MIIKLSRKVQREATATILRFTSINAIGVGLTFGSIISLLALYYGASDTQVSIIYASIFIASIASLLAPQLLNGKENTKIWRAAWLIRSFLSASYLLIPFLPNNQLKINTLITIYFLFLSVRAIGTNATFVAQKSICPPAKMQEFTGKLFARVNICLLLTGALSFFILDKAAIPSQELAFMILLAIGVTSNFLAAKSLKKLPKTGYIEGGGFNGLIDAFHVIRKNSYYRETIWLTILITGQVICSAFIINYLKVIAGYSSGLVLAITSAGFLAGAVASYFITITGNHITHKAFYFIANILIIIISLLWSFINLIHTGDSILPPLILFSLTSFCATLNGTISYRLKTARLPKVNSYQVSIIYQLVAVLASLLTIITIHFISKHNVLESFTCFHTYSATFMLWTILSIAACILSIKMQSEKNLTMKSELSSLSPANILDIFRYHRTGMIKVASARNLKMDVLMQSSSPIAKKIVLAWLDSPDIEKRIRALRTLNRTPHPEAFAAVLVEAIDSSSPLQTEALTTLGILKNRDAIIPLQKLLDGPPSAIQPFAIKTLTRLKADIDDATILACYWGVSLPKHRLQILLGISETKRTKLCIEILTKELEQKPTVAWT